MSARNVEVAIVGMGCTRFGDHWNLSFDDLAVDASSQAVESTPRLSMSDIDAFWIGTSKSAFSGLALSRPLGLDGQPVTRLENMCATGSDAFRNAAFAVASGAYDVAMAVGVEKLKDTDAAGLVIPSAPTDGTPVDLTAPAMYSFLVESYRHKYGVSSREFRDALTHIAAKNHANGARNSRAQFQRPVSKETIEGAPTMAGMLGVFDCSGISDGGAAAIVCRAEDAHKYTDHPVYLRGMALVAGPGAGTNDADYDFTHFPEVSKAARIAYAQAGITDPATEVSLAEVHDCFTPTELVLMEDLGFSARGEGWRDVLAGRYDHGGALPVNPDGGLKSFGHPVGASGLRMMFEVWLQLRGEAGDRQVTDPRFGLTHNLGGQPGEAVSFVSVFSNEPC
ncbi:hypothetical protein KG112_17265 [Nocardioides sp. zg-ZUI104]|uniref:acetyl-CoA acetyltransferase n=1 Tax=Nocardioides faecalis TaxID=2803858 RepID=UPI001BCEDEEC|nr:acetyl-CoA acetyltransferase [Nocardioides faecalis]MBS4754562.1 hypothetical protein [Nocardioides faecalis]